MHKVQLGQSGVEVSALCLGTDAIGSGVDRATSFRLLDLFREQGGTFLDTGNFYAAWADGCVGGESESTIGAWLEDRGCRDEMVVATKLGFDYPGCSGGLSAAEIERECDKSLARLGTDCLDLYYAHRDDPETPLEETLEAFDHLVRAGKVRAIAASNLRCWRIAEANTIAAKDGLTPYCAVQQRHTYLRPRHAADFGPQICINDDLRDYCSRSAISLIGYSILLRGAYMREDRSIPAQFAGPESDERLAALREVVAETGAAPNQVIIAWLRQSTPPILPIIAGSRLEQLEENIAALDLQLSDKQMERLTTAGNAEIKQAWLQ